MWAFLIGLIFVVVVVLILLIFYVGPELAPVVVGPTGATGPTDEEKLATTAHFFDGTTSVASDIPVNLERIKNTVNITIPPFSFDDGAGSKTGEILATGVVPVSMRPSNTVYEMVNTISSTRKIGILAIFANGDIAFYVDAQVSNLVSGATWATSNNSTGNVGTSYNIL